MPTKEVGPPGGRWSKLVQVGSPGRRWPKMVPAQQAQVVDAPAVPTKEVGTPAVPTQQAQEVDAPAVPQQVSLQQRLASAKRRKVQQ